MQGIDFNDQVQSIEAVASEVISPPAPTVTLCSYGNKLTREELAQVRTPAGTATHKPIPHTTVVEKLIEALKLSSDWCGAGGVRHIGRWHAHVRGDGSELRL